MVLYSRDGGLLLLQQSVGDDVRHLKQVIVCWRRCLCIAVSRAYSNRMMRASRLIGNPTGLVFSLGVLIVCLLFVACGDSAGVNTPQSSESLLDPPYSYGSKEFTIQPPKGWKVTEGTGSTLVFFGNPEPDLLHDGLTFFANINIVREPAQGSSLDEHMMTLGDVFRVLTDYELLEDERETLNGKEVQFREATFSHGELNARIRYLIVVSEDVAYSIGATSSEETWDKYEAIFDLSLRSFVVN